MELVKRAITYVPQMWKAVAAGGGAAVAEYRLAWSGGVTAGEWVYIVVTAVAIGATTWLIENRKAAKVATNAGPV